MPHWTVYTRTECSLCDQLLAELGEALGASEAASVEVVDVSQDLALERKYGLRVPVLLADGEFVCAYRLDIDRVRALAKAEADSGQRTADHRSAAPPTNR